MPPSTTPPGRRPAARRAGRSGTGTPARARGRRSCASAAPRGAARASARRPPAARRSPSGRACGPHGLAISKLMAPRMLLERHRRVPASGQVEPSRPSSSASAATKTSVGCEAGRCARTSAPAPAAAPRRCSCPPRRCRWSRPPRPADSQVVVVRGRARPPGPAPGSTPTTLRPATVRRASRERTSTRTGTATGWKTVARPGGATRRGPSPPAATARARAPRASSPPAPAARVVGQAQRRLGRGAARHRPGVARVGVGVDQQHPGSAAPRRVLELRAPAAVDRQRPAAEAGGSSRPGSFTKPISSRPRTSTPLKSSQPSAAPTRAVAHEQRLRAVSTPSGSPGVHDGEVLAGGEDGARAAALERDRASGSGRNAVIGTGCAKPSPAPGCSPAARKTASLVGGGEAAAARADAAALEQVVGKEAHVRPRGRRGRDQAAGRGRGGGNASRADGRDGRTRA